MSRLRLPVWASAVVVVTAALLLLLRRHAETVKRLDNLLVIDGVGGAAGGEDEVGAAASRMLQSLALMTVSASAQRFAAVMDRCRSKHAAADGSALTFTVPTICRSNV